MKKVYVVLIACVLGMAFFVFGFIIRDRFFRKETKEISYKITVKSVVKTPMTITFPNGVAEFTVKPFEQSNVQITREDN